MFIIFNKHKYLKSTKKNIFFFLSEDNANSESQEEPSEAKSGILPNVIPNVSSWTKVLEDTVSVQLFMLC